MARPSAAAYKAAAREMWAQLESCVRHEGVSVMGATAMDGVAALLPPLAALHAARQRLGDISMTHAAVLVEALQQLVTSGSTEAITEGWPQALELLGRWARGTSSSNSAVTSGPISSGAAAAAGEPDSVAAVMQMGTGTVLRALSARALPPTAVGGALAFLGVAVGRPGAPSAQAAASAAVAALHDLGPAVVDPSVLSSVVAGMQQLLEACLTSASDGGTPAADGPAPWLLTSLLQAAATHVPTNITAAVPPATASAMAAGCPAPQFAGSNAADAAAASTAGSLCALYALGRRLSAAALLRPAAVTAAPLAGDAAAPLVRLEAVAGLLEAGAREGAGDLLAAALCATTGAGLVDGVLASAPQLRASAGPAAVTGVTSGSALVPPPFALPASHPLAGPCMRLFAGVVRVAARCAEATNAFASPSAAPLEASGESAADTLFSAAPRAAAAQRIASVAASCVGFAYSQLLRTHGAVVPAQPTTAGLLCALGAVLDHGLPPATLYRRGLSGGDTGGTGSHANTSASLAGAGQDAAVPTVLEQEVGPMARWVAEWAARAPSEARLRVAARLHQAARRTAGGYARYAAAARPEALAAGPEAVAIKNVLDRTFAVHVALSCSLWPPPQQQQQQSAGDASARALLAATLLATFARLQFCRLQLPQYSDLTRALVAEVAESPEAAERLLIFCARYRSEQAAASVSSNGEAARSSSDSGDETAQQSSSDGAVGAATLAFLLPLIPIALRAARDPGGGAADAAVPLILLAVAHPAAPVALAAHSAFAGSLSACSARNCGADLAERAAPAYVRACADAWPAAGSYEGMQLGFHFLWQQLPVGSGAGLLVLQRLCDRAAALADDPSTSSALGTTSSGIAHGSSDTLTADSYSAPGAMGESAGRLFALVLQGLMSIDYQQLPAALAFADGLLARVPAAERRAWVAEARAVVLASTNAVTKASLVAWVQAAAAAAAGTGASSSGPRSRL